MRARIKIIISANKNANMEAIDKPKKLKLAPIIMAMLTPNSAAEDIPKKYGSTSGFLKIVCTISPASDSITPTAEATRNLGNLISNTIE